jgi:hypothetical protein
MVHVPNLSSCWRMAWPIPVAALLQMIMQWQSPSTGKLAFVSAMGVSSLKNLHGKLNEKMSYVCEFCRPWNKIVRRYETTADVFTDRLLTASRS